MCLYACACNRNMYLVTKQNGNGNGGSGSRNDNGSGGAYGVDEYACVCIYKKISMNVIIRIGNMILNSNLNCHHHSKHCLE